MIFKYITVINTKTHHSVPFTYMQDGEIQIVSTNPEDDEDSCRVIPGNTFYEHSIDFGLRYGKV